MIIKIFKSFNSDDYEEKIANINAIEKYLTEHKSSAMYYDEKYGIIIEDDFFDNE